MNTIIASIRQNSSLVNCLWVNVINSDRDRIIMRVENDISMVHTYTFRQYKKVGQSLGSIKAWMFVFNCVLCDYD